MPMSASCRCHVAIMSAPCLCHVASTWLPLCFHLVAMSASAQALRQLSLTESKDVVKASPSSMRRWPTLLVRGEQLHGAGCVRKAIDKGSHQHRRLRSNLQETTSSRELVPTQPCSRMLVHCALRVGRKTNPTPCPLCKLGKFRGWAPARIVLDHGPGGHYLK